MNFKQYTIAFLIILFCAGSVIVGIRSALTSETSGYTSVPDKEQGFVEYQGSPYSTVYYSAPAQGTAVAVPMRSVNSVILRHSQPSYYARASTEYRALANYASQGLYQTSHQMHSYGGTSASGGYVSGGSIGQQIVVASVTGYSGYTSVANPNVSYAIVSGQSSTTPMLAQASVSTYVEAMPTPKKTKPFSSGPRRVAPSEDGYVGETYTDADGNTWTYTETDGWVNTTPDGTTKIENGKVWRWDATNQKWVFVADQADPDSPVGDIPWLFFGLLVAGYVGIVTWRKPKSCDKQ